MQKVAEEMGRTAHLLPTQVAVFFGDPKREVSDPYFGGRGPSRTGCNECGGCMTGCRFGAKNTLDLNYLWLAEGLGAEVRPETEVTWIRPLPVGFEITARTGASLLPGKPVRYRARNVILSGGVLGTVELLLRLKGRPEGLPELSERVGDRVRTNSEVLVGVTTQRRDLDLSKGVAITSILQTDDTSWVEPVRFSSGSGLFRLLAAPHAPGSTPGKRILRALRWSLRHPGRVLRMVLVPDWARYTTVLLFMRTEEGTLRLRLARTLRRLGGLGLTSRLGEGPPPTAAIPEATTVAQAFAEAVDGTPGSLITETLFGIPTTAHILGGACMGSNREEGVIDQRHRVFGYPGLMVVDGSAVSANPGVNPSLTIAALAERAMSFIPAKVASPVSENINE